MAEFTTKPDSTINICGGILTLWSKSELIHAYDDDFGRNPEMWAVFEQPEHRVEIRSGEELYQVLLGCGCDLVVEAAPMAATLADVTAKLMRFGSASESRGQGRAIHDERMYRFLERYYDFSLRGALPRIKDEALHFLLGDFSKAKWDPILFDVSVDLRTGAILTRPTTIPKRHSKGDPE